MLVYRLFREVTLHSSGPSMLVYRLYSCIKLTIEHSTTCDSRINLIYIVYVICVCQMNHGSKFALITVDPCCVCFNG